jgi:4-hydroxy-tetrahydrodipicolinate synthase
MHLSGTVVPMATPIAADGRTVDEDALSEFTRSLVDAGVHGLFPGSSIGEFPSLTDEQNRTVVETVVRAADDETTVLAGCCDTSAPDVRAKVAAAAAAGADAAVVVTPYYLDAGQAGLRCFFEYVAADAPLPVVLYNIPALTGNELAVETVRELAAVDGIVGLKDTSGDLTYQYRAITETPSEFAVFQGATDGAAAALTLGADGLIAGPANVFPGPMADLYDAHAHGDDATVTRLTREVVMPVVSACADLPTAAALKYLVKRDRLDIGGPLPPLAALSAADRERLDACYRTVAESLDPAPAEGTS